MQFKVLIFAILFTIVGCGGNPNRPNDKTQAFQPIAICGAGYDSETGAKLEAAWTRQGGQVTAGFKQSVKAVIFNSNEGSNVEKTKMYDKYVDCALEIDRRVRAENAEASNCRAALQCDVGYHEKMTICLEVKEENARKFRVSNRDYQEMKMECFASLSRGVKACYGGEDASSARSKCEQVSGMKFDDFM